MVVPINPWDFELDVSENSPAITFLRHLRKEPNNKCRLRSFFHKKNPRKKDDEGRKRGFSKTSIEHWQRDGRGIYVVIGNGGDEDAEITSIPAFFIEWDDIPLEKQLSYDWSNFLTPSMTVPTVNSGHNYWILKEDTTDINEWKWLQERLIAIHKSDKSIKNPSRVMRLPGCWYADEEGKLVKEITIHSDTGLRYTVDEIRAAIEKEEQRLNITPGEKPKPAAAAPDESRNGFRSRQLHTFLKQVNARPKSEVISALKLWPPRVPGEGTYRGQNPVTNKNGREVHIDYFQTAVGCLKAFEYAGVDFEEALELMMEQHPEWVELRQNLEGSGGAGYGGKPIEDNTFWRVAIEELDWEPEDGFVAEDDFTCSMQEASEVLKQNRITASENFELMNVLPKSIALPMAARAETFPVHQSALFGPFVSAFSTLLGTRIKVQVKVGHQEPMCFWIANVQLPSSMKSPVGKEIGYEPLENLHRLDCVRYSEEREKLEEDIAIADHAKKSLQRVARLRIEEPAEFEKLQKAAEKEGQRYKRQVQSRIKNTLADVDSPVQPPRATVTKDSTIERLAELLVQRNNYGLLLYFDELARFMETMDAYRQAGGDRQVYLDLWSGSAINIQRVGSGLITTPKSALSLFGYIQHEKLRELLGKEGMAAIHGGDGFWARWLFCTPPHVQPYYNDAEEDIADLLRRCLLKVDTYLDNSERVLSLSTDAFDAYKEQVNQWVDDCRDLPLGFQAALMKMKGYLARFAGLLHCIEWSQGDDEVEMKDEINLETMNRAIQVCLYFRRQYELVMTQAGATGIPDWVTRLEQKVEGSGMDQITTSNLTRWRMAEDAKDANEKICLLVDELGLGNKRKNRQGNWVWQPRAENPNVAAAME